MRELYLTGKVRVTAFGVVLAVLSMLPQLSMQALAQQQKPTAPEATAPGGRPVAPNRSSGVRGGFDAPSSNEAVRPAPEATKPVAETGGPSVHRVSRSGVSTYPLGTG